MHQARFTIQSRLESGGVSNDVRVSKRCLWVSQKTRKRRDVDFIGTVVLVSERVRTAPASGPIRCVSVAERIWIIRGSPELTTGVVLYHKELPRFRGDDGNSLSASVVEFSDFERIVSCGDECRQVCCKGGK